MNPSINAQDKAHIYFSPHFDDVVLSCGGLIGRQVAQAQQVTLITIFAKEPKAASLSAFARHLHAKWNLDDSEVVLERRIEDRLACQLLEISREHWGFLEAPYRTDRTDQPLYCSYETTNNGLVQEDVWLKSELVEFILSQLESRLIDRHNAVLYFPLGVADHVDHQLLAGIGFELQQRGYSVCFYEEWPYVEAYQLKPAEDIQHWQATCVSIAIEKKTEAAKCYTSQLAGLGGSAELMARRLQQYAGQVGGGQPAERLWEYRGCTDCDEAPQFTRTLPFKSRSQQWRLGDFKGFLQTLRWHNLDEIIPVGRGVCVDIGCGSGRHQPIVEAAGYHWIGLDYPTVHLQPAAVDGIADMACLPVASGQAACAVLWQVLEYSPQPERALAEAARILEAGGVLCGSASFMEPLHGKTLYSMSPLLLEQLLQQYGFADVEIIPGLSGFALMLWTWLRRYGGDELARLALPVTAGWMLPLALIRFFLSWLFWRWGRGTGHGMAWISRRAPLEFAGHVIFVARKTRKCTLHI